MHRIERCRHPAPVLRRSLPAVAALLALVVGGAEATDLSQLTLEEAIRELETRGLAVVYSSDLVKPWMLVREPPASTEPAAILAEIVAPYRLAVRPGPDGALLIVRAPPAEPVIQPAAPAPAREPGPGPDPPAPVLEEIVVNASLYRLIRESTPSVRTLDAAELARMPDIGDDAIRAVARLPGAAGSDFTAKSNVRGGDTDEMLVRFDDLRLYDPFHLKDFQSVFSSVDPSVVSGIDVYTGGFPVVFGDRMSGVIDIEPLIPESGRYRELSLSFFNAGAVLAGRSEDGDTDWLVSARRGNLDLVLDVVNSALGEPSYLDFYGRLSRRLTDSLTITANALVFDDDIRLFDSDQEERARADYRDEYLWLRADYEPSAALSGVVLAARSDIESWRRGSSEQEGISTGSLSDRRDLAIDSLQTDWTAVLGRGLTLEFGGDWRRARGSYRFEEEVSFDLLFDLPGAWDEEERSRDIAIDPAGDHYGLYANLRAELSPALTVQAGLRWDKDTLSVEQDQHVSPRLALMYRAGEKTTLRASWGRFYQSQSIHELQVADGITVFPPAQRSDHLVLSLDRRLGERASLRLEGYRKRYTSLRPRFENLINTYVLLPELKPDRIAIAPTGALARGAEISLRSGDDDSPLDWWLGYAWSRVEDELPGIRVPRSWDQTHAVNAGLAWTDGRWDVSVAARYHTGWPTTAIALGATEPVGIATAGPRNGERFDHYRSVDARVARRFALGDEDSLTLFLEVHNLFGRSNPCCLEYEFEDEDGEIILDTKVLDYLPLFPSLGFVWRF